MEAGRWWTHLGFERGNAVVEAQQRVVGRPWSRMVKNGSTTIATNATTNNKLYRFITLLGITEEENLGATLKLHVHRSCNKRYTSRWSTEIGHHILGDKHLGEEQKYNNISFGRPWSAWAGTNVVERFVGLRFRLTANRLHKVRIESGGHHQISWHWGVANWNDRNIWFNDFAPTPGAWYEVRIMGDVTAVNVEGGVTVELLDFYNPGRGTPVYLKVNGNVVQTWNPIQ